jgi:hypothetical protein
MKNVLLGFAAAIVMVCAAFLFLQHQAQEKLQADNAALMQQLAQLQNDNESLSNQLAAAGDAKSLPDKQFNELLKLRGEVGVLRRQVGDLGKMRAEDQQLRSQNSAAQSQAVVLTPEEKFNLQEFHTVNAMKMLGLAMRLYAGDHNDQYATNFDQLKDQLGGVTNFPGNISLAAFEFVNAGLVNDTMPDKIILRERVPRQLSPDGGWQRIYGLADGSVQTIYSYTSDGNFDDFEKPRLVSLPPNQ